MSVLKNWDINLRQSEKKTLFSFFLLYSFFTILLLLFMAIAYYNTQKDLMLQNKRLILSKYANQEIKRLKYLQVNFDQTRIYPRDSRFKSAIYDSAYHQIFSLLANNHVNLNKDIYLVGRKIHFTKELELYYLGAKYLVIEVNDNGLWRQKVYKNLTIYGSFILLILLLMGYFLMNLLLKPMKEAISLLDRFIKDTTHELNTPVSTILSNIELSETKSLDEKLKKRLNRIKIAAKTISNLYQDLVFLTLENKVKPKKELVDLKELLSERVEYFLLFLESKEIKLILDLKDGVFLHVDKNSITKLIDNLFSNAIKYNKMKGRIEVVLRENFFYLLDNGRGIEKDKLKQVFNRYERADKSVGGFGIGLSIVSKIAEEYNLKIDIESEFKKYTKVKVSW